MKVKKLFMFLVAAVFVFALAACKGETTAAPTTAAPTTAAPTTAAPTTAAPTTAAPTTMPTTVAPTTISELQVLDILADLEMGNDGVYSQATVESVLTVSFNKHGFNWPSFNYEADTLVDYSIFNKLVMAIKGEGSLLVQFEGATKIYEAKINVTPGEVTHQFNLRDLDAFLEGLVRVRMVAMPGMDEGVGEVQFSKLEFDEGTAFGTVVEVAEPAPIWPSTDWVSGSEGVYAFAKQIDGSVDVTYDKGATGHWEWMKNTFDQEEVAGFNTMTIKLTGTVGKKVMLKPNDSGALEKTITFADANPVSYTITASNLVNFLIFAEPDTASVSGTFTIESLELSYVAPEQDRFEIVDFLSDEGWTSNKEGIYTFTEGVDKVTIAWDRLVTDNWTYVKYTMPEFYGNHNAIQMTVKGTAGQKVDIKPNDKGALETWVTLTGDAQTVLIPMGETPTMILMFLDPEGASLTGSVEILEAKVIYVAPGTPIDTLWVENDLDTYTVTAESYGHQLVEYTKNAEQAWAFMKNTFDAETVDGLNQMMLILEGTVGKRVLVKPNNDNSLERWVTFNDKPIILFFSADAFTDLYLFAEPEVASVTGSFKILGLSFSYVKPEALARDIDVDFETGWVDNDGGLYTFAVQEGKTLVTWDRPDDKDWAAIKYVFTENLAYHNTITMVVQGTIGQQLIIKPNDSNLFEKTVTFDGTEQTVTFDMTVAPEKVIILVDPLNGAMTGSFSIISAIASWEAKPLAITDGWAENDPDTYVIDQDNVDGSVVVTYTKSGMYQYMINNFDLDKAYGLNTMTLVVQGTSGKTLLVKPNDSNTLEQTVTFDGTEQTFTYTANAFSKLLLFIEPVAESGTGTFTIKSVTLSYVAPVE
ncbi:MAG: hypothetical protein PHP61_06405 [Candidatus Izemoplasmatales bacterium]|nr:hypothetical protein [Candidatus Izemoplasmatales bacterium]